MQICKILSDNGQKNLPDNVSGGLKNLPDNLKNHRHLSVFRYLIAPLPVRTDSARLGDDLQHRVIVLKAVFWTTSSCFAVIPDVGLPFLFGSEKSSSPYVIFGRTQLRYNILSTLALRPHFFPEMYLIICMAFLPLEARFFFIFNPWTPNKSLFRPLLS